jgi:hypothetical protein
MVLAFGPGAFLEEFGAMRVEASVNAIMVKEQSHGKHGDVVKARAGDD